MPTSRIFRFTTFEVTRAYLVAGFGQIEWIEAEHLILATEQPELAESEADILAHMNREHAEAVGLYATRLLGL